VIVQQTNILASTAYPGAELLTDGDMEAADTSAWLESGITATKETGTPHGGSQVLRLTYLALGSGLVYQSILEVGKTYHVIGYARSDGTGKPRVRDGSGVTLWTGTTSTDWQAFDFEFTNTAGSQNIQFYAFNLDVGNYVEFDDLSIREVNPLNGDITGATINQDAGRYLKRAFLFDGTNDYVDVYSPELNSLFDPTKGTLLAFAKVANAGVWTDGALRRIFDLNSPGNDNRVLLDKHSTNNTLRAFYVAGGVERSVLITTSTADWFMFALTWDVAVDEMKAFFNGPQSGSTQTSLGAWEDNFASTACNIGAGSTTPTQVFDGLICHPVLFRDVLTDAEILKIAKLGGVA